MSRGEGGGEGGEGGGEGGGECGEGGGGCGGSGGDAYADEKIFTSLMLITRF